SHVGDHPVRDAVRAAGLALALQPRVHAPVDPHHGRSGDADHRGRADDDRRSRPPRNRQRGGDVEMLFFLFIAVAIGVWVVAEAATSTRRQRRVTLDRVREYGSEPRQVPGAPATRGGLLSGRFGRSLARFGILLTPGRSYQAVTSRLFAAGVGL